MSDYKTEPSKLNYTTVTTPLSGGDLSYVVKIHGEDDGSLIKATTLPPYAAPVLQAAHTARSTATIQHGQWSAKLFGCFDFCVPNGLMATFCPCVSAAQIASRLGYSYRTVLVGYAVLVVAQLFFNSMGAATFQRTTEEDDSWDHYSYYSVYGYDYKPTVWGALAHVASMLIFVACWKLRMKVRRAFNLPGSCLGDFCMSLFCSCCSLAQMATHVKSYKPGSCSFGPPDELAAYSQ